MHYPSITPDDKRAFDLDGFVIKRSFFNEHEASLLSQALHQDDALRAGSYGLGDRQGGSTIIAVWNEPGDDTLGIVPRLRRMADGAARLLGGEVYHYHSKITSKAAGGGGTWDWHQDYGYWYKNGCLFPDMASVAVAVSEQTSENGALRVLRGSHKCGRLEHFVYNGQTGADVDRLELLLERLEVVTFEAEPGDTLFFHSNTLHSSSPNLARSSRDVLLCCYNRASNDPAIAHHHPQYTPLDIVDDGVLQEAGLVIAGQERDFMDPATDISIGTFTVASSQ